MKQIKPANRSQVNKFDLIVKVGTDWRFLFIDWRLTVVCFLSQAEEVTSKKRFSNAMLRIDVGTMNGFSPRLVAEALEGFVEENSPVGTPVISARRKGQPLQLKVVEEDPVRLLVLLLFVL